MSETVETAAPEAEAPAAPPAPAAPSETAPLDWRAALPEDLRAKAERFADPAAVVKSYVEAEALIGRKGLIQPKEGDPDSVTAAWRQGLGVPDTPDGYALKAPDGTPEHLWNGDTAKVLSGWAHELGLPPAAAQGLAERYAGMLAQHDAAAKTAAEEALRKDWGADYDRQTARAAAAAKEFLGPELQADLAAAGLGHSARMLKALARIGEAIGTHDGTAGMNAGTPGGAEPKAELATLMAKDAAYWNPLAPGHRAAVARVTELHRILNPG